MKVPLHRCDCWLIAYWTMTFKRERIVRSKMLVRLWLFTRSSRSSGNGPWANFSWSKNAYFTIAMFNELNKQKFIEETVFHIKQMKICIFVIFNLKENISINNFFNGMKYRIVFTMLYLSLCSVDQWNLLNRHMKLFLVCIIFSNHNYSHALHHPLAIHQLVADHLACWYAAAIAYSISAF